MKTLDAILDSILDWMFNPYREPRKQMRDKLTPIAGEIWEFSNNFGLHLRVLIIDVDADNNVRYKDCSCIWKNTYTDHVTTFIEIYSFRTDAITQKHVSVIVEAGGNLG